MQNYRVNINELFDNDEDFLFQNEHFRALIKKTKRDFEYLVNPIFDLDEVVKNVRPEVDDKYLIPQTGYQHMNQADLILLYANTFNCPARSRFVYDRMMAKYDEFFNKAKEEQTKQVRITMQGQQVHTAIQQLVEFYDQREANKNKIMDEDMKRSINDSKNKSNAIVDSLIETLCKDFGETSVNINSSRKDKINLLR